MKLRVQLKPSATFTLVGPNIFLSTLLLLARGDVFMEEFIQT
jgi:hypothetical protein